MVDDPRRRGSDYRGARQFAAVILTLTLAVLYILDARDPEYEVRPETALLLVVCILTLLAVDLPDILRRK